jgi:3-oxosteroid 1-dehydrogenase
MSSKEEPRAISRRDFVRGAAVAGGAAAASTVFSGCGVPSVPASMPATWDHEADLVCIGYGGAGAVTAITAADLGANVLIIEKHPPDLPGEIRHTPSARMCDSIYICPTDAAKAAEYMYACSWGSTPRDVCEVWAKYTVQNTEWLEKMGGNIVSRAEYLGHGEFPLLPGCESIEVRMHRGRGPALFKMLSENVAKRPNIRVMYETPARQLVTNADREVVGVIADQGGKQVAIKAKKAVILTCGGFEWDEEMKLNFLRAYPIYFYCNPGNTGDGIRMAQSVGAALWHMNTISGRVIPKFPNLEPAMSGGTPDGFIFVDKYGKRFIKERPWVYHSFWLEVCQFDTEASEYPRVPCYSVFDDVALKSGDAAAPRSKGLLPDGKLQLFYEWSKDSVEEIKKGWVLRGATIEELAKVIAADSENAGRMQPAELKATVDGYNRFCQAKKDRVFDRDPQTLIPVQKPPFYAIKMYPGGPNTQGGPKRNAKSQVVDSFGKPIPRLYAAGELGSVYGFLYPTGGGNVAEFISFGRIAAEQASAEKPWA